MLRRTQTFESDQILIRYCTDCTYKISGSMTLVKIWDTVFQYPQIQYISIVLVSWVLQGKQSIRIGLFPLQMYIPNLEHIGILIFLHIFYRSMAKKISTLPWVTKFLKLYFGQLNLWPCGHNIALNSTNYNMEFVPKKIARTKNSAMGNK